MTEFDAVYYDGQTAVRRAVRVCDLGQSLHIAGAGVETEVLLSDIEVDPPVGGIGRALHLPGGAELRTDDHAAVESIFGHANRLERFVHGLERRWPYALGSIAAIAAFAVFCITVGFPAAARRAAALVSPQTQARLGDQALRAFDGGLCRTSALDPGRKEELRRRFETLTAGLDDGYRYRLELRNCGAAGANAFALPGGAIVLTDDLVKLANDAQISAALAHEIGHVRERHGLRIALQAAGLTALFSAIAGDAVSITSLAVTLPTTLLQRGYSREFESEADEYAFRRLREIGLSPQSLAELLERLQAAHKGDEQHDYLSTHPATEARIQRALAASRAPE